MLVTIKEFADNHKVTTQAVRYLINSGNIKCKVKFGVKLIESSFDYSPVRGRGRKKKND